MELFDVEKCLNDHIAALSNLNREILSQSTVLMHAQDRALRTEGCNVIDKTETSEQGKFGWDIDPEGNKVEV